MNLIRLIKEKLPTRKEVAQYRYIHIFGDSLKNSELWSFSRNPVSKGAAIGLFCAFLPMPFETVAAIFFAIHLSANLPLAAAGVWISNPITWIPLYTPCYLLGSRILGLNPIPIHEINLFSLGWHYVALWLGCLIIGGSIALCAHFLLSFMWRLQIVSRWRARKSNKKKDD